MRIGYTIVLNGEQHLLHNNYFEYLIDKCLDYLVVVEGASESNGSTVWCTGDNSLYHNAGHSIDKTLEILCKLKSQYPDKMDFIQTEGLWYSKDEMVNAGMKYLRDKGYKKCFLWQIDVDEQWTAEDMYLNELMLVRNKAKTGAAKFYQYVGKDIIALGPNWGDNYMFRLWNWEGEDFATHEPQQELVGGNGKWIILPFRYNHYAYYFEDDVKFKSEWYGYGEEFFERWKSLQVEENFPQPLSRLFPDKAGKIVRRV